MNGATIVVVVFLLAVGAQRLTETFARRGTLPGQQQMQWSFYAFFILHTLIMLGALVEYLTLRKSLSPVWSAVGVVLYVTSLILRNVAIRTLGKFWSLHVEIRREHQLIREGIYSWLRHPAYAAIVLEVVSIPIVVNAWWTLVFAVGTYIPLLLWRLHYEEKALVEKFGDSYRQYQREVGALLPKRRARRSELAPNQ